MLKIDHIRTVGFKGFDIDEDVPAKVIYSGKNKTGKTTRAYAIALALYGNIPFSTAGKRPSDILDSFGGNSLVVAVKIGGKEFGRKFARNEKGVSQVLQYDGKRCSADVFSSMLGKAGLPKIADQATFMSQSDTKKVDTLFELFPDPELATIDQEIETAKADVSRIEKQKDGCESTISRLTTSKNAIEKPSGTIASIRDEIKTVESQIADLERQIKAAEIEEAKAKAVEQEKREEAERKEKEKIEAARTVDDFYEEKGLPEPPLKTDEDWAQYDLSGPSSDPGMQEADQLITKMENQMQGIDVRPELSDREFFRSPGQNKPVADSIQNIIDALIGAGCSTCAALIVAKQELKKYV
jgi:DNA repair exonuclease SbcCD ATPase subunit